MTSTNRQIISSGCPISDPKSPSSSTTMLEYIVISVIIAFLISTWLRQYVLQDAGADVVDRANTDAFTASDHLISKRGSSRRKAFYKRNSPLNDYLEKNLSKTGDNVSFQSGFPWRTYVAKSRHESKLTDLDQSELKLYESIFELILTEKSYLMVSSLQVELAFLTVLFSNCSNWNS